MSKLLPEDLMRFTLRDLIAERKDLEGAISLGNEIARAEKYDRWIVALEEYCKNYDQPPAPKCCVCETTENLFWDGAWYGWRCKSVNCMVF